MSGCDGSSFRLSRGFPSCRRPLFHSPLAVAGSGRPFSQDIHDD